MKYLIGALAGLVWGSLAALLNACITKKALEKGNVMDCIECGSCAYGCPAGIPLVQSFRTAKKMLRDAKAKEGKKRKNMI